MPKIELSRVPAHRRTGYPKRFHTIRGDIMKRRFQRIGEAGGLSAFGVTRVTLEPGGVSSLRHWHTHEDEFVVVLEGELVMITDEGETIMRAGDMAAFAHGVANGHHFLNRSPKDAVLLAVGPDLKEDVCYYSDVDLKVANADNVYRTREGAPYDDVP